MRRFSKKTYVVLALLLVTFAALWMFGPEWTRTSQGMITIQGNTPGALNQAHFVSHADTAQDIEIAIGLKLRDEPTLDAMIARQSDPQSRDFRKFINPDEFVQRFAPTQADVDKLTAYLQQNGLTIISIAPNRLLVHVKGSVAQIEQAFRVKVNTYTVDGRRGFSNDRNPSIPAQLKDVVASVMGLNSIVVYHSHLAQPNGPTKTKNLTPSGYGPAALSTAYNFPTVNNANRTTTLSGKSVTIAIATAYTYQASDVQSYWRYYNIHRTGKLTDVFPSGATTQLDGETTLDLEQISSLAPGADVKMYMGKDPEFLSFALVFNQIVIDNEASVASVSWGLCEEDTGAAEVATEHVIFKEGSAQGITFKAAAGDDGAYDCKTKQPKLAVDYPASDPYVTAVGGTALHLNADFSRLSESAWTGAGGGISHTFAAPTWQFGPGVPSGSKQRNSSDLSLNADPHTADSMFFQGSWDSAGGTSFATPDTAALWGLAVEATGSRLGLAGPALYRLGNSQDAYGISFFDVTTGNNGDNRGPGYDAGPGWDYPTGWGAPDGNALIDWLIVDQTISGNPAGTPLSQAQPLSIGGKAAPEPKK